MFLGEKCFAVISRFAKICFCLSLSSFEINWKASCKCRSDCGREALLTLGVFPEV